MKQNIVHNILLGQQHVPKHHTAHAFAPSNIALCKYWGKRNESLRLPMNNSLSISLGEYGTHTSITVIDDKRDKIFFNRKEIGHHTAFSKRLINFLDLFRVEKNKPYFLIETAANLPVCAGFASSASGFAALTLALQKLFDWHLTKEKLSILARLGSGSAARSLWHGFVKWHAGHLNNGMDSYAEKIPLTWNQLCIGLLVIAAKKKKISSSHAMAHTILQSKRYTTWPQTAHQHCLVIEKAIKEKNMILLGQTAQQNSIDMHAVMHASDPPINYNTPQTNAAIHQILGLQKKKHAIYFTQDAGSNLILLFTQQDMPIVLHYFPQVKVILPFANKDASHVSGYFS
jgi:diphosphomevalonate decarboxylase